MLILLILFLISFSVFIAVFIDFVFTMIYENMKISFPTLVVFPLIVVPPLMDLMDDRLMMEVPIRQHALPIATNLKAT